MSTARQIGSLGEGLLDQAIRECCVDRLSWHARWHIEWLAVPVLGKAPLAGRDERSGEKFPVGIVLSEVRGNRCRVAGPRHKCHHCVGILAAPIANQCLSDAFQGI